MNHIKKYRETLQTTKDKLQEMIAVLDTAAALDDEQLDSVSYQIWKLEEQLECADESELYLINELNYQIYSKITNP